MVGLRALAACDRWWFYLAAAVGFGLAAAFAGMLWARIEFAFFALLNLYNLARRLRNGPHFERVLQESTHHPSAAVDRGGG